MGESRNFKFFLANMWRRSSGGVNHNGFDSFWAFFVFRSVSEFPCAAHVNCSFLVLKAVMQKVFNDILRETDLYLL